MINAVRVAKVAEIHRGGRAEISLKWWFELRDREMFKNPATRIIDQENG